MALSQAKLRWVSARFARLFTWLKRETCHHKFAIEDLNKTGIPEPEQPENKYDRKAWEEYWHQLWFGDWTRKRVMWPCAKCGKIFYAHCGLDISPKHGPMFRRKSIGRL